MVTVESACALKLTLDVTGAGAQQREPNCAAVWRPVDGLVSATAAPCEVRHLIIPTRNKGERYFHRWCLHVAGFLNFPLRRALNLKHGYTIWSAVKADGEA